MAFSQNEAMNLRQRSPTLKLLLRLALTESG